jgi:hypothetical protein
LPSIAQCCAVSGVRHVSNRVKLWGSCVCLSGKMCLGGEIVGAVALIAASNLTIEV